MGQRRRVAGRPAITPHQRVGVQGQAAAHDQRHLDRRAPADGDEATQQCPGADDERGEHQVVEQRAADDERRQVPGAGVDVVEEDAPDADGDDQPAHRGGHPEPGAVPVRSPRFRAVGPVEAAHSTTTEATHLVWSTPGRFGAISRHGAPWSSARGSPSRWVASSVSPSAA